MVLRGLVPPAYIFRADLHLVIEPYGNDQILATSVFINSALKWADMGGIIGKPGGLEIQPRFPFFDNIAFEI